MKPAIFLISSFFHCILSLSQDYKVVDSLKKILTSQKTKDTNTANVYSRLGQEFMFSLPDSSVYFFNRSLILSQQLEYIKGKFYALIGRSGQLALVRSDSAAVSSALSAVTIAEKSDNRQNLAEAYLTLASVYMFINDFDKATIYHHQALKFINPKTTIYGVSMLYIANEHLAECYLGLNKTDSAFYYINEVLNYNEQNGILTAGYDIYLKGNIFLKEGHYDIAMKYFKEALGVVVQQNIKKDMSDCNIGISRVFQRKNLPDSAIYYARQALTIAKSAGLINEKLEALQLLISVFEFQSKIDSAYTYQKYETILKDSVFNASKIRQVQLLSFNDDIRKLEEAQQQRKQFNNTIIFSLIAGLLISVIIGWIVFKNSKQRQRAYILLQKQKQEIDTQKAKAEQALQELKSTQVQLIQSEKMASLGELTAGIAHEIQNPLNFVNNFSDVNAELVDELKSELSTGNTQSAIKIADNIKDNEQKINHHGKRADAIVKGMLQHSRTGSGQKEPTDINVLADEYLRLAYHGFRAKEKSFNVKFETRFDPTIETINVIPQDIGRVLLNLINNAFYAASQNPPSGGREAAPTVWVNTKKENDKVLISVKDNGPGIPKKILDKIFQPFFTTKPTGQGTGLGLSLAYDIIKAHGGELKVGAKEGEGAEFIIQLPLNDKR